MLAPLALSGCILPVGEQVASLIADGVSLMTTDKTLTDHGLSTVTEQDCAIWRVINGEEVCRDYDPGDGPIMTAGAEKNDVKPAEGMPWRPVEASYPLIDADDMTIAIDTEVQVAGLEPIVVPAKPAIIAAIVEKPTVPALPSKIALPSEPAPATAPATPTVKIKGGMFYVIASFSHINGAEHFARRHVVLATQVLAGTARGKDVYRVAVGPVSKVQRSGVKAKLVDAGFADTWAPTLKSPKIIVEVAALN